jgi:hypothetical protein
MIKFEPLLGIEELSKELGVNKYKMFKILNPIFYF